MRQHAAEKNRTPNVHTPAPTELPHQLQSHVRLAGTANEDVHTTRIRVEDFQKHGLRPSGTSNVRGWKMKQVGRCSYLHQ